MDDHHHIHKLHSFGLTMCWLLLLLTTLPQSQSQAPPPTPPPQPAFNYSVCMEKSYDCGSLSGIFYPFWGQNRPSQCGGGEPFRLICHDDYTTTLQIGSQNFQVKEIHTYDQTMRVVRAGLSVCSPQLEETYVDPSLFRYSLSVYNITVFYDCPRFAFKYNFTCGSSLSYFQVEYEGLFQAFPQLQSCKRRLHMPTVAPNDDFAGGGIDALTKGLDKGFVLDYNVSRDCTRCLGSEGNCSSHGGGGDVDVEQRVLSCYYCPDGSHDHLFCSTTNRSSNLHLPRKIIIGLLSAIIGGFTICIIISYSKWKSSIGQVKIWFKIRNDHDIEAFLRNHGALAHRRYKYSEVKKMTNSFKVKLGEGGFGAVYKGELINGCPVAVKILNASKGNGEDFINEVASISRTSHVNVVTLLGFCLEGRKKALIYEFMSNGSLDKFIYDKGLETIQPLSWDNLWKIAIGIGRGLEYLHRGCNTRILHFDIKPHNILLDENFWPKISDFGLAKLCPRKESIISMSNARGTIGYVAPEVWNRNFGGISHKSDVYSYGMMLLEMVGGRKNINAEASHTSEIYFPHWVYNKLEQGGDLRPNGVLATEENEIARRMIVVGLWCVQTFPKDRPTMSRVIDMLEDNMNSLEIPPKPVLSSPTRSTPESTTS